MSNARSVGQAASGRRLKGLSLVAALLASIATSSMGVAGS